MANERGRRRLTKEHGVLYYLGLGLSWGLLAFVMLLAALVVGVPAATGSTPYTILTSSMEPGLPPGTLVVVKPIDPDEIRIGTVITYQLESGEPAVVTHRVVEIQGPNLPGGEPSFITKGDANAAPDAEPVLPVQVRGSVWYSVPYIGWVNNVVNGDMRNVVIPIAAGLLFLYAGFMLVSHRMTVRRRKRREAEREARHARQAAREQAELEARLARVAAEAEELTRLGAQTPTAPAEPAPVYAWQSAPPPGA
jgi:signal peptidase